MGKFRIRDLRKGPGLHQAAMDAAARGETTEALSMLKKLQELLQLSDEEFGRMLGQGTQAKDLVSERRAVESPMRKAEGGEVNRPKLSRLQAIGRSLAGAVPFTGEEEHRLGEDIGDNLDQLRKIPQAGIMTQWWGINPDTQELEYAGPGSNATLDSVPDEMWQYDPEGALEMARFLQERRENPQPEESRAIPGIIDETMALPLFAELLSGGKIPAPEISQGAGDRIMDTEAAVLERLGIEEPEGLLENVLYSGGIMAGQLPVPGAIINRGRKAVEAGKGALSKVLGSGVEFLSPIIEPKMKNYIAGTLFGGGMMEGFGRYGDYKEEEIMAQLEEQDELRSLIERHEAGDKEATAALLKILQESDEKESRLTQLLDRVGQSGAFAKGGKIKKTLSRRDLLKGLGAAGAAGLAGGKAAIRSGNPEIALKQIEEALNIAPAATKGSAKEGVRSFRFSDLSPSVREKIGRLLDWQTEDLKDLAMDEPEFAAENYRQASIGESISDLTDPDASFTPEQVDFLEDALDVMIADPTEFGFRGKDYLETDDLIRRLSPERFADELPDFGE